MVYPAGLEPATGGVEFRCSIQLSYGYTGASGRTRTSGLLIRNQALYPTELQMRGVRKGTRTPNLKFRKLALCPLSYTHMVARARIEHATWRL